ncbi:hypothetical protein Hanom_Chr17g01541571 [Helianthus anomalus]
MDLLMVTVSLSVWNQLWLFWLFKKQKKNKKKIMAVLFIKSRYFLGMPKRIYFHPLLLLLLFRKTVKILVKIFNFLKYWWKFL